MLVFESLNGLKLKNVAVAIGMFDGLHRGHLEVIKALKEEAALEGKKTCVMSFDMEGQGYKKRILAEKEKKRILETLGIDYYIRPLFSKIKYMSHEEFLKTLIDNLGADIVFCGKDFRFGYCREGDIYYLKKILEENSRRLKIVETLVEKGAKISSTDIRLHIEQGNIKEASFLLGRLFSLDFDITKVEGEFLVQELDQSFALPPDGVYISEIRCFNQQKTKTFITTEGSKKVARTYIIGRRLDSDSSIKLIDKI